MSWGPIRSWPVDRAARDVPGDLYPGDWIMSDLMVRPHLKRYLRQLQRRDYYPAFVWVFGTGEAFMLDTPANNSTTHLVLSYYRVWQGTGEPRMGVWEDLRPSIKARAENAMLAALT